MNWALVRRFPKYVLVFAVIVGSTAWFTFWRFTKFPKKLEQKTVETARVVEDDGKNAARAEERVGSLLLVDNDLYDVGSGEVLFKNWLKQGPPLRLMLEPDKKTLIAQYERGFVRYRWDGTEAASLTMKEPLAVSDDYKFLLFVKDKDIWRADIDWKALKLANERQVTSIGQFMENYFAANLLLGTDKTIVVRNMNVPLRVNLETGEVHPARFPLTNYAKQRSPNGRLLVGTDRGEFFCYDVDTDAAKTLPLGERGRILDYQWLGNERCAVLEGGTTMTIYDPSQNTLTKVVALPLPCRRIELPSPSARFFFCTGNGRGVLVDVEKKTAVQVTGGQGVTWVSDATFFFSRDVPDSTLRGAWRQTAGEDERKVSPEPFLSLGSGAMLLPMKSDVVFATKQGLLRMKSDGSAPQVLISLPRPLVRAIQIVDWKID